jgi:hypothetical protein
MKMLKDDMNTLEEAMGKFGILEDAMKTLEDAVKMLEDAIIIGRGNENVGRCSEYTG